MSTIVVSRGTTGTSKKQVKLKGYVIAEKSWNEFNQALKQLFKRYSVSKKTPAKKAPAKKKRPARK